jgi:hypothetical protein
MANAADLALEKLFSPFDQNYYFVARALAADSSERIP